jgi:hypothetical protein
MKKILSVSVVLILVFFFGSCGPSPKEAAEYNDKIVNTQAQIMMKMDSLDAAMATYEPKDIESSIKSAKIAVDEGIKTIDGLNDFNGESVFKEAAVKYFKTIKSVLDSEFVAINQVIMVPDSMYGPKEEDVFNKMKESYEKRLSESLLEFVSVQQDFAKSYNVEIH